jgi:predicted permease
MAALIARLAPIAALERGGGGLRASSSAHAASAPRLRRLLVATQLAMALVVCLTAALVGESLRAVRRVDPGFATAHVLSARVSAFAGPFPDKLATTRFFDTLVSRLREAPGVAHAAAGSSLPLSGSSTGTSVMAEGQPVPPAQRPTAGWQIVTPGYFAAVGIPIRTGRDFLPADATRGGHHVVINEALARLLFGSANPVGRRLSVGGGDETADWHEIVGVAGDVRHANLTDTPAPRAYDLSGEHWARTMFLVVRGTGEPAALAPVLRRAVAALDPGAPVFDVRPLEDLLGAASAQRRVAAIFTAGVGATSLVLAALGVYGLLASSVAARTRELGVRRALGSSAGRIMALVGREALEMSAIGITVGVAIALAASRVIQAQLYGVTATDPFLIAAVALLLVIVAAASALAPALRAARVDPVVALKTE